MATSRCYAYAPGWSSIDILLGLLVEICEDLCLCKRIFNLPISGTISLWFELMWSPSQPFFCMSRKDQLKWVLLCSVVELRSEISENSSSNPLGVVLLRVREKWITSFFIPRTRTKLTILLNPYLPTGFHAFAYSDLFILRTAGVSLSNNNWTSTTHHRRCIQFEHIKICDRFLMSSTLFKSSKA